MTWLALNARIDSMVLIAVLSIVMLVAPQHFGDLSTFTRRGCQPHSVESAIHVEPRSSKLGYVVNPLSSGLNPPKPTGLATYGVLNSSGSISGYAVRAHTLVGELNLSSIAAYYPNASLYNASRSAASLQLNAMLIVNSTNTTLVYWVQNVIVFLTNNSTLFYADNIWNMSGVGATLTNNSITSNSGGYVTNTSRGPVYGSTSNNYTYMLPLSLELVTSERVVRGLGVQVGMGVRILRNGTTANGVLEWYDNATIRQGLAKNAYFLVSGYELTPPIYTDSAGFFYDAELVFGGEANGAPTNFTHLNATLGLYYQAGSKLSHFPSYYSFGADTAESTFDLHVRYLGGGAAAVSVGQPDYEYLTTPNTTVITTPLNESTTPTTAEPTSSTPITPNTTLSPPSINHTTPEALLLLTVFIIALLTITLTRRRVQKPTQNP
ncbi:hypothetical protein B9Q03_06425 [Candidatus Marsarchaeota G2 archaeon OSP_D]|uniref:Thermopsin n=1 Tax=Candidatus Marsarchaeota G2 archaeon OSP_D TaxID=1978157 RepID=A0A2R6AW98_9ARCH|nr:MAG: hypothetical protein B9Q03_06425 [Candidatus Marsarchaeota G2 archaeon OSP_D]